MTRFIEKHTELLKPCLVELSLNPPCVDRGSKIIIVLG